MEAPKNLLYTREHEWTRIEGSRAAVGISDHAQHALGDVTFVELPVSGQKLAAGGRLGTVESVKAVSDVYTPLSGTVVEVNRELEGAPELINQSPYDKGWIAVIEISDATEKEKLMTPKAYEEYIETL